MVVVAVFHAVVDGSSASRANLSQAKAHRIRDIAFHKKSCSRQRREVPFSA
jgi:hypothetical protein